MRIIIGFMKPIVLTGTAPGGVANFIVVPVVIILFILSLLEKNKE